MSNLQKHQGKIFTKDNIPDLLDYLADYMREHSECKEGFGLEYRAPHEHGEWTKNNDDLSDTVAAAPRWEHRPAPPKKTMYNIYTGEPVEVSHDTKLEIMGLTGTYPKEARIKLTEK